MSRRKRNRRYSLSCENHQKTLRAIIVILLPVFILLYTGYHLLHYVIDYLNLKQANIKLQEIYYQDERPVFDSAIDSGYDIAEDMENDKDKAIVELRASALSNDNTIPVKKAVTLPITSYPLNPHLIIFSRFKRLREKSKDIIGWLCVDELVEQAVVQRNNTFYLNRDAYGNINENGALFLDEECDLTVRPYTLIIYGHNMKSGEMFGNLRRYEKISYYKSHPFLTFDSMYEDGKYVVFAVSRINAIQKGNRYVNIRKLSAFSIQDRMKGIDQLMMYSTIKTPLDIQPEDQLLLLVTCGSNENERLVVAARRVRDQEDVKDIDKYVQLAYAK